jgi:hypothetical protein
MILVVLENAVIKVSKLIILPAEGTLEFLGSG